MKKVEKQSDRIKQVGDDEEDDDKDVIQHDTIQVLSSPTVDMLPSDHFPVPMAYRCELLRPTIYKLLKRC